MGTNHLALQQNCDHKLGMKPPPLQLNCDHSSILAKRLQDLGILGHYPGQDPGILGRLTLAKRPKILARSLPENPCLLAKILGFNPGFILQCILAFFMYMHVNVNIYVAAIT
eukprot:Em0001g1055a